MDHKVFVKFVWNFFPFTLIIWEPFWFIMNIFFVFPYLLTLPLQILFNTIPELILETAIVAGTVYGFLQLLPDDYDEWKMQLKQDVFSPEFIIVIVLSFAEVIVIWLMITFPTNLITLIIIFIAFITIGIVVLVTDW